MIVIRSNIAVMLRKSTSGSFLFLRIALRSALRDGAFGRVSGDRLRRELARAFDDARIGLEFGVLRAGERAPAGRGTLGPNGPPGQPESRLKNAELRG